MKMIYLDMDGTIANLYGVQDWLLDLENSNPRPYKVAKKLVEEEILLNLIASGYELGVISWLAKNSNKDYDKQVRQAKKEWLKDNYPNVEFKEIHIVKYGTPKYKVANVKGAILIDDEINNRNEWKWVALDEKEIYSL